MLHTVHLVVDEVPAALARAARVLEQIPYRLQHLVVTPSPGVPGRSCLTAVFDAPPSAPVALVFAETVRGAPRRPSEPLVPFHWQADGAGDHGGR